MTVHNFGVFNLKFYIKITTSIKNEDIHAFPNKKQMKRKTKLKSENTTTNTYPVSNTKTNTYPISNRTNMKTNTNPTQRQI